MARVLIMLPEAYPVAKLLCDYLFNGGFIAEGADLLILAKQRSGFAPLIEAYPFGTVHILDEEYYGRVKKASTEAFITECMKEPYETAYFPFNTFKGNAFLLGGVLAKTVKAVNASLYGIKEVPVVGFSLDESAEKLDSVVPWNLTVVEEARTEAAQRLKEARGSVTVSGERPSFGLVEGFAHDIELFCNYAIGLERASGKRVLDIGGGLGYGTYLLSRVAREVVYIDKSPEVVEMIEKLWVPLASNIEAVSADVTEFALEDDEKYDTIFLMEMLEHIEEPEALLGKIKPLVKEGGAIIITTPEEDLFPYTVCPEEHWPSRAGKSPDELLQSAVWPWHIQPLGEWALLPMLERVGLKVEEKSYITYSRGREFAEKLSVAVTAENSAEVFNLLNCSTVWSAGDFAVTRQRDPVFSAFFYNVVLSTSSAVQPLKV